MSEKEYKCPKCKRKMEKTICPEYQSQWGRSKNVDVFECVECDIVLSPQRLDKIEEENRAAHNRYMERVEKMARSLAANENATWSFDDKDDGLITCAENIVNLINARSAELWEENQCSTP